MSKKSKAKLLGLVERIVRMYNDDHDTCESIEQKLRAEGYDISREAIRRTVKTNKDIAGELLKTREETVALIDAIRDNPGSDANEATLDFLIAKTFEFTKSIEELDFKDLPELASFVTKMTRSKTQLIKVRMDYKTLFYKVRADVLAKIQAELKSKPELRSGLEEVVLNVEPDNV